LPTEHRFFAAIYDRLMAGSEDAGLAEMRAETVGRASGRTLELGAGTGLNLEHYTDAVSELVLTEPDPHMAKRLRRRLTENPPAAGSAEVVEVPAESLPFEDASFDSIVSTLVLCTVEDPDRVAGELARLLRPGGRLLYLEHVRDPDEEGLARWQDRLERPWGWFAAGCHPNRSTEPTLEKAGFDIETTMEEFPKGPPIVRPLARGSASLQG
jgi:ubiquinone/menaquinone biosynthesis C-methylase UbiE